MVFAICGKALGCSATAIRTAGASNEAIGKASHAANEAVSITCRTAARLPRGSQAAVRAMVVIRVALAKMDAASQLLSASIALLIAYIMITPSFRELGRFQLVM